MIEPRLCRCLLCLTLCFFLRDNAIAQGKEAVAGVIQGKVVDSRSNEPLSKVLVKLIGFDRETATGIDGTFRIESIPPGEYSLNVSTVGYHMLRQQFSLAPGKGYDFDIVLTPSASSRTDSVEVNAGPFDLERQDSPTAITITATEAKNLASVLADDPLRAVQSLPGVTSDNDFNAEFSLRGASFNRIGIYLDGILLHDPFHKVEGQGSQGSLTAFNGDVLQDMTLYEGAWPVKYSDRTAGILSISSRDGGKDTSFRVSTGFTNTSLLAEGSAGKQRKFHWIADFRKSYLQYLLDRIDTNVTSLAFGFTDWQGRLTYDLAAGHKLSLSLFEGTSSLDRSAATTRLGLNALLLSSSHFTILNLEDRYAPTKKFFVSSHLAWARERGASSNSTALPLVTDAYGEWTARTDASYLWATRASLSFGGLLRRLREDGSDFQYQAPAVSVQNDRYRGTGTYTGAYGQQQYGFLNGRIQATAGMRFEHSNVNGISLLLPHAAVSFQALEATKVSLGWGQYAQQPELSQSWSVLGRRSLRPERSTHFELSVEQALNEKTRARFEVYDRQDRDLLWRPLFDARLLSTGNIFFAPNSATTANSQRGYARGAQAFLQRRTANGFTGWISYAYSVARVRDGIVNMAFPTDNDQKHTVNVFGSYRLRPTVNLSVKWLYGSGFPVPGFYRAVGSAYYLAQDRNQLRLPSYTRLDFRVNKAYVHDKWKWTLFAECVNLTNRTNRRFDSYGSINRTTGQAFPTFNTMFPILPSVGVVFER